MKSYLSAALLLTALACRAPELPAEEPVPVRAFTPRYPIAALDVEHYDLAIGLFPQERRIAGQCTIRAFAALPGPCTIALDVAELEIEEVLDPTGRVLEFRHEDKELLVTWPVATPVGEPVTLRVRYQGSPAKGLWWAEGSDGETFAFTHGQCDESSWWFPCNDVPSDRATSALTVEMPGDWISVAAGDRIRHTVEGERCTEAWQMRFPHPVYLTTLVAGPFERVETDWEGVPIDYLAPKGLASYLEASLGATVPALRYFSELLGQRYPFGKYTQACVPGFPFGGMENISATTLTIDALSDEAGLADHRPDILVAHEIAHQWIGDLATVGRWSDIWLQEGLATYLSLMYLEHAEGKEVFQANLREKRREYLDADTGGNRRPIVHAEYDYPSDLFGTGHAYQGGATRFHLLRTILGEADFQSGLRLLVGRHAGGSLGTEDVRAAFEEASGKDLSGFFRQWLRSPGYPEVATHWRYDAARARVILSVNQVQSIEDGTPSAFRAPVDVEVMGSSKAQTVRIEMEKRRAKIEIPFDEPPRWVRFDPKRALPARIRADKSTEEWLEILAHASDLDGRLDALEALGRWRRLLETDELRKPVDRGILSSLETDELAPVRRSAARHVAVQRSSGARAALERAALEDSDLRVRRAALESLAIWSPDGELADLAQRVFDERASWATMGAAARLRVAADPKTGLAWVRARLTESTPNEILRRHLLSALGGLPSDGATQELRRWLKDRGALEEVRAEAARQLARRAAGSSSAARQLRAELISFLDTDQGRLRRALVDSLSRIREDDVRAALATYRDATVHDRERRVIEAALAR